MFSLFQAFKRWTTIIPQSSKLTFPNKTEKKSGSLKFYAHQKDSACFLLD